MFCYQDTKYIPKSTLRSKAAHFMLIDKLYEKIKDGNVQEPVNQIGILPQEIKKGIRLLYNYDTHVHD